MDFEKKNYLLNLVIISGIIIFLAGILYFYVYPTFKKPIKSVPETGECVEFRNDTYFCWTIPEELACMNNGSGVCGDKMLCRTGVLVPYERKWKVINYFCKIDPISNNQTSFLIEGE